MVDFQSQHQNQQNRLHRLIPLETQNAIQKHFHKFCCFLFLRVRFLTFGVRL